MSRVITLFVVFALGAFYLAVLWLGRHPQVDELYRLYYIENRLMFWSHGEGIGYTPGERLTFDRRLPYLSRSGWWYPEVWGTRSLWPYSELLLRLDGEFAPREVVVEGEPFLGGDVARLTVSLTINGHAAGSHALTAPGPTLLRFAVPAHAVNADELLVLRFSYESTSPAQHGRDGEPAFGFIALTLH